MPYSNFPAFSSSFRTASPPFTVNNSVPEYGYRDWDVISHFEEAAPIVNKPSIFRRFIRAILGINLLFGPHFDSIEETLRKRKTNRGRSNYLPWKSFFDSQDTVIEHKPVPNTQTAFEVFWPPNSPTLRRVPGSRVVPKPQIPPIEELINITRKATPLSMKYRYDVAVQGPRFSFPQPVATTTLPEFSVPPTPAPQPNTTTSSPLITFSEVEDAELTSGRSSTSFQEHHVESAESASPSIPYPERYVEHAEYAGSSAISYHLERQVELAEYAGPFSSYTDPHVEHSEYAAAGPSSSYPNPHAEHTEYAGPSTTHPNPKDNSTRSSTPEAYGKPMIFTSRVRFPLALGITHVAYKLREKPPRRAANRLRRPSWATISSSLYSYVGNLDEELEPSAGPSLQFPTISFNDDDGLIGFRPEPEPEMEEEEERRVYDIQFYDYEGGKCLALADFEVPEGYDEEFASVQIDYGHGGERIAMDEYAGNPDEEMKMKDSGVVVFMFLPIED